ncbi:Panacea domain-containing protein [Ferrimicrobium acidiphilum]|uniref:Panacea domain-containing protein n=1 Tax=Ferrimicrobium acidiphilum TaxID=121039 RepID=UPI0023F4AEE1|nr:type II toxin-antitoxin system antitoxin SocA domain-containing protein [Ferrimicrobium acidiphilum]
MADVIDVAEAILEKAGPMDSFRLQKLVYYSQACHLAYYDQPLFEAPIKAWVNGPVVPALYHIHRGTFGVTTVAGDNNRLTSDERSSVAMALKIYGSHTTEWLVEQTHMEPPWLEARGDLPPDAKASPDIQTRSMKRYYRKILVAASDVDVDALADQTERGFTSDELRERYSSILCP